MDKKFMKGFLLGLASTLLIITFGFAIYTTVFQYFNIANAGATTQKSEGNVATEGEISNKIKLLETYISKYFLNEIDQNAYAEGIYKGLLESLEDPYSVYYTKEEFTNLQETSSGIYCGIGATVSQDTKTGVISIVKPFLDGPANKAGILPGDIIYKVNKEEVTGVDLTEVVSRMKGKEGTTVEVSIMRKNVSEPIDYQIKRATIEVPTIQSEMLDDHIGYIAISGFDEVTAKQFRIALDKLENQSMEGLIIDLRNNGGGLLTTVVDMLKRMLPEGMIVYTKDKNGKGEEYKFNDKEQFTKPLTVLINGNSASASEVFAGAIQDYEMGTLVGTTSFGKGIVQSVLPLGDGSAIKLTTSKYYTPKGRNIHGTGIVPDIEIELKEELMTKVVVSKEEDNQLQKAIEVIKKKMK